MADYKNLTNGNRAGNDSDYVGSVKKVRAINQYDLFRGVTDFGNMSQFDYYESGYSFLFVIQGPKFLNEYANKVGNEKFKHIYLNYMHMLEFEFLGLDGLENMTSESLTINNGIDEMNLINKVKLQSASNISMRYTERSGGLITKFHSKFLSGIRDPRTQVKHYHGLIADGTIKNPGFEYETFTFLYVVTDNTTKNVEKAWLIVGAQPTSSELNIYNSEKGNIEKKEINVEFQCFPIQGSTIDEKAQQMINAIHNPSAYGITGGQADRAKYIVDSEDYGKYTIKADGTTIESMSKDTNDYKNAIARKTSEAVAADALASNK